MPLSFSWRLLLAALSGVLLGLCFPTSSWVLLLPVALVPFFRALQDVRPLHGWLLGYAFGIAFWISTVPWIGYTVHHYGGVNAPLSALALLLTALILGTYFSALGLLVALARPGTPLELMVVWPCAWVVQEGLRTYVLSGFPWALLGYALAAKPELIQGAALAGTGLVTLLVVVLNVCAYLALRHPARRLLCAGTAGALIVVAFTAGRMRITRHEGRPSRTLRVALMQPGVLQEARWSAEDRDRLYADLLADTYVLCAREHPDLVLWPESAMVDAWPWSARLRHDLPELCKRTGAAVLFSTAWSEEPEREDAPYFNSALLVTGEGAVLPPYHKLRLVPFGEYVPFGSLLTRVGPISKAIPGSFTPGKEVRLLPFKSLRLGGAVCYEVIFGWIARAEARSGADVLFTLTNDSWYGGYGAKGQHWQAAVLRAVETGRPLVRAAITGRTGWVDPLGRSHTVPEEGKQSLVVDLPLATVPAPAVALGETLLLVCAAAVAAVILRGRLVRARPEGPTR